MDSLFFTEEHIMIRDMVREFADSDIVPVARTLDETGEFPKDLVEKMSELGLMGIIVPEQYGGAGLDMVAFVTAIMELGRADASVAITMAAHTSLGTLPLLLFGNEDQKIRIFLSWLPARRWVLLDLLNRMQAVMLEQPKRKLSGTVMNMWSMGGRFLLPMLERRVFYLLRLR